MEVLSLALSLGRNGAQHIKSWVIEFSGRMLSNIHHTNLFILLIKLWAPIAIFRLCL